MVEAASKALWNPPLFTWIEIRAVLTMSGPIGGSSPRAVIWRPVSAGRPGSARWSPLATLGAVSPTPATVDALATGAPPPPRWLEPDPPEVATYPMTPATARNPTMRTTSLRMGAYLRRFPASVRPRTSPAWTAWAPHGVPERTALPRKDALARVRLGVEHARRAVRPAPPDRLRSDRLPRGMRSPVRSGRGRARCERRARRAWRTTRDEGSERPRRVPRVSNPGTAAAFGERAWARAFPLRTGTRLEPDSDHTGGGGGRSRGRGPSAPGSRCPGRSGPTSARRGGGPRRCSRLRDRHRGA